MIMPRGQQLLLPANPIFIYLTLFFALLLDMVQNIALFGNANWAPELIAVVLLFWGIHQPLRVSIGLAFFFGLLTDVHQSSMLGQHALSFTAQGFFAVLIHRRILWFKLSSQSLQVFPIFLVGHLIELIIRMASGSPFPGWGLFLSPIIQALLWPIVSEILLAPQKRSPNPDNTRPL
jgi:rod shape-determining protein MreD